MVKRDLVRWKRWMVDCCVLVYRQRKFSHRMSARKTGKAEVEEANEGDAFGKTRVPSSVSRFVP